MEGASTERGVQATPLAAAGAANGSGAFHAAVAAASAGLEGAPSVVFAFPSGSTATETPVSSAARKTGAPVVGMSGSGSIGADGAIETGCSALALSESVGVGIGIGRDAGSDLRAATRDAADAALAGILTARRKILLLFLDARTGDQADAVAGAYGVAGPEVPLAGGAAGGAEPFQIAGEEVLEKSVVAVALGSESEIGLSQVHGCRMVGTPAIVTSSSDRVIHELNGRPALDVFLEETGFAGARDGRWRF